MAEADMEHGAAEPGVPAAAASSPGRHGSDGWDTAKMVLRAGEGDQGAWQQLVERFSGLVWAIARTYRLSTSDAADVSQTVWLRLVEHLGRLRDPATVAGWLATTTRHECIRTLRRSGREVLGDDSRWEQAASTEPEPESVVLRAESRMLLRQALDRLSHRCQLLLRALAMVPTPHYAEISAALTMPVGSIGPTRQRCLAHLRRELRTGGHP